MITHWTDGCLVLRGDRALVLKGRKAETLDIGDESTALIIADCASPWAATEYCRKMDKLFAEAQG